MYKKQSKFQKNSKFNQKYFKQQNSFSKKNNIYYLLGEKKPSKPLTTIYLQRNKRIKIGFFLKQPSFNSILYPFHLNLKLINEYLKKK